MKRQSSRPVFKSYNQKQLMILPPSLDELIEPGHPVRIVDELIDKVDDTSLLKQYKGGGTSSYHPRMLLKVMIYSYLCNIYSSRKMEAALKENIHFMWLSGMNRPDHNTINRFRSEKLKDVLKEIFAQVVMMLAETDRVSLKDVYLDGTKIEANANRYTFVWGKAVKYNKERMAEQLNELWAYTQKVAAEELGDDTPTDFPPIDPQKIKETIEKIDEALKGKPVSKEVKEKIKYAKKHWPENLKKYQKYESLLGKRNSMSKTDPDATFMRMKEDHMRTGTRIRTTENGYEQQYAIYQANNCEACPLRKQCNKNEGNKTFEVNHQLNNYKIKASALLNSESGLYHRSRRPIDVEPVFANLKHNKGFKRFNLRGLRKVEIETGLLALAHNIKKKAA